MPFNLDEYEPVEDRLRAFWEEHPHGRVFTELVHTGTDGYIVKASVWRGSSGSTILIPEGFQPPLFVEPVPPDSTGYAQEAVTERGVNATSALENCETSAIGRALANLGYAAKGKRPSREEMTKASGGSSPGESASAFSSSQQETAPPEPTSVGGRAAQSRATVSAPEVPGASSASTGTTSGAVAGDAGSGDGKLGEGQNVSAPELATEEDWATATKNGLTATKAKAIAKSIGITVANATDLTRSDFAAVINKYFEIEAAKKR